MVCSRCKMVVKSELEKLGLKLLSINLGEVEIMEPFSDVQKNEISKILKVFGFELIDDKKSKTIDKIKTVIIDLVQNKNNDLKINLSTNSLYKKGSQNKCQQNHPNFTSKEILVTEKAIADVLKKEYLKGPKKELVKSGKINLELLKNKI